jgi:hypothetical protein
MATEPAERPPDASSSEYPPEQRPRLRIMHLLVLTVCTAFYLSMFREAILAVARPPDNASFAQSALIAFLMIFISAGGGLSLGGLVLWAAWRRHGIPFPVYPGEYFLAIRAVSVVIQTLLLGSLASGLAQVPSEWMLIPLYGLWFVEFMSSFLAAGYLSQRPWPTYFFLRGWLFCCPPLGLPLTLVGLPIIAGRDHHRGRRYPWTHWLGVALELWWNLLCALLLLLLNLVVIA